MARIKKHDTVHVIAGKDRGKQGVVVSLIPKKNKVKVKNIALMTKHVKARKQGDVAGIHKEEAYIFMSKVMLVCTSCKKPCRVGAKFLDDGKKVRVCSKCKEVV